MLPDVRDNPQKGKEQQEECHKGNGMIILLVLALTGSVIGYLSFGWIFIEAFRWGRAMKPPPDPSPHPDGDAPLARPSG
ncbi:hypothetical protein BVY00_01195 [bacterium G20]|nr:hypothetical protein BVY00_01195 [bacterium G20]